MKLKCIDNSQVQNELTLEKTYDVLHTYKTCYVIINDKGVQDKYMKERFEVIPTIDDVIKAKQKENSTHGTNEHVNHPNHYNKGKFEVIEVIEDWGLGFNLGNAIKYIGRCEHKGNKKQDLEKALWYIKRELEKLQNKLTYFEIEGNI